MIRHWKSLGAAVSLCFAIWPAMLLGQSTDVTLAPTSLSWGNVEIGQTSAPKTVTLTNNQSTALQIAGMALPLGSDFIQTSTTCPLAIPPAVAQPLPAGGSCAISVAFRPLAPGARTSRMSVLDNAPSRSQQVMLSGNAVIGPLLFSPTSMSFANVPVGTVSTAQTATLTNEQTTAMKLNGLRATGDFEETDNCPASLAPGAFCTVDVMYAPKSAGYVSGYVSVSYPVSGGAVSAQQLYMDASTPPGFVTLSPPSYDYGAVGLGSSADKEYTVTNNFASAIAIESIANSSNAFNEMATSCPTGGQTLAPRASCTITVRFTPGAAGAATDTLTVKHSAPNSPATAALSGSGFSSSGLSLNPGALSWGKVETGQTSAAKTVTVTNSNTNAITIASIATGKEFVVTASTCPVAPSALGGGATCTISIAFRPLAQGPRADALTMVDSGSATPQSIPLSGVGAAGALLFSPTAMSFPTTAAGTTSNPQFATLTNTTHAAIDMTAITRTRDFPQLNNCQPTLQAGASCTFTLTFAPVCGGEKNGNVTVHAGSYSVQLYLSGTATGMGSCPPQGGGGGGNPGLSVSPGRVLFGTETVGSTTSKLLLVTNYQTYPITIAGISIPAPFTEANNCAPTLPQGFSCDVSVTYAPTGAGYAQSALSIADSAMQTPQMVPVTGNAVSPVAVMPRGTTLYFANQRVGTSSVTQAVTITNRQAVALRFSSITSSPEFPVSSGCGDAIAAGASCTVDVSFAPQSAGRRTATLTINENAYGSPVTYALVGTGVSSGGSIQPLK